MARTYGAIYLRIWRDPDWRTLHYAEQYLYMTLVSQAKLNRAGLLEYSPRRWAEAAVGLSPADVEVIVKNLEQRKYVVLDETTNELLIRTYVRNGDAWKMPKVMAAVVSAADEIDSPKLRRALLLELDRIPLDELSDTPAVNGGTSIRAKIEKCIDQLRALLGGDGPDGATQATPAAPCEQTEESPTDISAEPYGKGIDTPPVASGTCVRAHAVPVPVPVPVPTPPFAAPDGPADHFVPDEGGADEPRRTETAKPPAKRKSRARPKPAAEPPDPEAGARDKLAREVVAWWWERLKIKPAGKGAWFASLAVVNSLLEVGWPAKDVATAARTIGSPLTVPRMEIQLNLDAPAAGIPQQRLGGNVLPFQRPASNDAHLPAAMERARARDAAQAADPARQASPWKAITA